MLQQNFRKAMDKTNEGTVNLRSSFTTQNSNNHHRKAVLRAIFMLTIIVLGAIIVNFGSSIAKVHAGSVEGFGVGIYWDQACTNRTLSLDWGPIAASSKNTLTVYVKNEGNLAVSLWLGTSNWTPSASSDYMSLNWNYSGQVLRGDQVIPLQLTLTVYPTITGITAFTFDTIITSTEN